VLDAWARPMMIASASNGIAKKRGERRERGERVNI
jgi:hypothetical protein